MVAAQGPRWDMCVHRCSDACIYMLCIHAALCRLGTGLHYLQHLPTQSLWHICAHVAFQALMAQLQTLC